MGLNVPDCVRFSFCEIWAQRLYSSLAKGIFLFKSHQPFLNNVNESFQSTPLWSATKVKGSMKTLKCWFRWWWLPFAPLNKKKKKNTAAPSFMLESFEGCLRPQPIVKDVRGKYEIPSWKIRKRAILCHITWKIRPPNREKLLVCPTQAWIDTIFVRHCSRFMFLNL